MDKAYLLDFSATREHTRLEYEIAQAWHELAKASDSFNARQWAKASLRYQIEQALKDVDATQAVSGKPLMTSSTETLITTLKELSKINFAIENAQYACDLYATRMSKEVLDHRFGDEFTNLRYGENGKACNNERARVVSSLDTAWKLQIAILKGLKVAKAVVRQNADTLAAHLSSEEVKIAIERARMLSL